jgi:hypothetical protein
MTITTDVTFTIVSAEVFSTAIQHALETSQRARDYLSSYTAAEYAAMACYLSRDGLTMFAVKNDGDLVSVCNAGPRGRGEAMMAAAIASGATKLDCFDGFLPPFYARFGFVEVSREANWTIGGADVVYMRLV